MCENPPKTSRNFMEVPMEFQTLNLTLILTIKNLVEWGKRVHSHYLTVIP
jgi:hypothetical protein